jgi:hypothetical protein
MSTEIAKRPSDYGLIPPTDFFQTRQLFKKEFVRCIIAGSRGIYGEEAYQILLKAIKDSGFRINEVVSGKCPESPDMLGERWAKENGITIKEFPAIWDDLSHPDAVIRTNKKGKQYDAKAGFRRNEGMAQYASHCIVLWTGYSSGSKSMTELALKYELKNYFVRVPLARNLLQLQPVYHK